MKSRYIFLITLVACSLASLAQTMKIQAPSTCEVGQRIRVSYYVNTADAGDISVGEFSGFDVLYGPSTSVQSSAMNINGKISQTSSITYTYTLQAQKAGTFKLPVATVNCGGKTVRSNSAIIHVVKSSGQGNQQGGGQRSGGQGSTSKPTGITKNDIFITATASKRRVFEQEAVLLTYKLYTLVNIRQLAGEMPELDGFLCQELDSKVQMQLKYERMNGRNYGTAIWRQYILFPQRSGKMIVPSVSFDAEIEKVNTSADPFDVFFGGGSLAQIVKKTIKTPEVILDVRPLPLPKPSNFSGAVGKYQISGNLTPEQVNANDAATLRLVVSGNGNMKLMKAPKVNFPKDFEVYDPKQNDRTTLSTMGTSGNMVYDYVVVPRHGGKFDVEPVDFVYFDPNSAKYVTLRTCPYTIKVAKGKSRSHSGVTEQEDIKVLDNDIHYIKNGESGIVDKTDDFFASYMYFLYYVLFICCFSGIAVYLNRRARHSTDMAYSRGKRASKAAIKHLKVAAKLLKEKNNANSFYDEVMKALLGYVGDKLNMHNTDLNKDNVKEVLNQRGVEADLIENYMKVLEECEFVRFAPGDPSETMDKIFKEAQKALNRMDKRL